MAGKKLRKNKRMAVEEILEKRGELVSYIYNRMVINKVNMTTFLRHKGIEKCPSCNSWERLFSTSTHFKGYDDDVCGHCLAELHDDFQKIADDNILRYHWEIQEMEPKFVDDNVPF